jgi:hypothetical protein
MRQLPAFTNKQASQSHLSGDTQRIHENAIVEQDAFRGARELAPVGREPVAQEAPISPIRGEQSRSIHVTLQWSVPIIGLTEHTDYIKVTRHIPGESQET